MKKTPTSKSEVSASVFDNRFTTFYAALFCSGLGALFLRRTGFCRRSAFSFFPIGRRSGRIFAIRNIPAAALKVDSRLADAPSDVHPLTVGACGRAAVGKRLDYFEFITAIMTDEFIDRHMHLLFCATEPCTNPSSSQAFDSFILKSVYCEWMSPFFDLNVSICNCRSPV